MLMAAGQAGWQVVTLAFWPLLGAILIGLTLATGRGRRVAHWFTVAGVAVSALIAFAIFWSLAGVHEPAPGNEGPGANQQLLHQRLYRVVHLFHWFSLGNGQYIDFNYFIDPLTAVMLVTVTFVSLMVVIYATGYMRDHHGHPERGYERFFAFLGMFVFSMCMLVLAGNFVLLYLGWELVGLCSYLLIGFYYKRPEAAAAAKKAFLVNRIGDFGFALGIFALYMFISPLAQPGENPLDYTTVFKYAGQLGSIQAGGMTAATLVSLLLFCGAVGKSAQFPLYVWLPDAMEGPTPVSALIHAATMVTAGVYMVARCSPIFVLSETALNVITAVGAGTALFAATMAMAQFDMKRILAYSTISQLAFMFVALGCGAPDSGVFHLYTHAFFKALLFLCAGSVMHAMGGVIDVRQFSGLRTVLPVTYKLTLIGCLALAGFPLLSGFFSKDEILHAAFNRSTAVGLIMLGTAFLTAYYTFRMFFLAFGGPTRLPPEAGEHPHESPLVMNAPLTVLALGALLAGYVGAHFGLGGDAFLGFVRPHGFFHHYLEPSTIIRAADSHADAGAHGGGPWLMYVSSLVALAGMGLAWLRYGGAPAVDPDRRAIGNLWNVWNAKYYVDEIYDRVFVRPLRSLGELFFATDRNGIDGLVWLIAAAPRGLGAAFRVAQRGAIQTYGLGMVVGLVVLLVWWLGMS